MLERIAPGTLLVLGALPLVCLPHRIRRFGLLLLPVVSGWHLISYLPANTVLEYSLFDYTLVPVRVDRLSLVWGYVFHLAAFLSVLYALHVDDWVQHLASLIYAGSAIGAVFAGDLLTLFVYWEITAVASVFLIWASGTERAYRAGMRYLVIQVSSGVLLLAGGLFQLADTGSLSFGGVDQVGVFQIGSRGPNLIFLAFGIKAAFPLLHNWLQDAYPEATVTGTVFLSAFTTKMAIYALARGFAGTDALIWIGAAMTAFPIFYAVIENDLRRVLAYSLNNQLGFMVVGVGIGTTMALNGTAAHAFAHILYKGLLFMSMGAVLLRTGTCKGSELGGLYKSMPWTTLFCMVGAAAISAFPLFSGFVSKSLILTAAADEHHLVVWLVLLFASAGVFHHSGIKIPFFAFFGHDSGRQVQEAPWHMLVAMGITAALCIVLGVAYPVLYAILPFPTDYHPYTTTHVITQLQLLFFSALAFTVLMRTGIYPPELRSVNLDFDWFYRRPLPLLARLVYHSATKCGEVVSRQLEQLSVASGRWLRRQHGAHGRLGQTISTSGMVLWVAILLVAYLLFYYR